MSKSNAPILIAYLLYHHFGNNDKNEIIIQHGIQSEPMKQFSNVSKIPTKVVTSYVYELCTYKCYAQIVCEKT